MAAGFLLHNDRLQFDFSEYKRKLQVPIEVDTDARAGCSTRVKKAGDRRLKLPIEW
jgi:hypothetical protein